MAYNPTHSNQTLKPRGAGKPVISTPMTANEAKQEAQFQLRRGLLQPRMKRRALIDLMSSAGVLPAEHLQELLSINERSVRRYREQHLLDRIVVPPALSPWFPLKTRYLYTLGMVGMELATQIHGMTPTGYIEAKQDKISHDVLCNLVYYHLYRGVKPLGYAAVLYNRYEATVHDFRGKPLLEPDAMVVLEHATKPRQVFLIEYHHEHFSSRSAGKVMKYEGIFRDRPELWQATWQTMQAPTILVVWTHNAVAMGYRRHFEERRTEHMSRHGQWLGKPLQAFLDKQTVLLWENLGTGQPQDRLLR
jgi:hypothetical protein